MIADTVAAFLDENASELSMFEARASSRFDSAHALGVMAVTIGSSEFSEGKRSRYEVNVTKPDVDNDTFPKKKLASLIIPFHVLVGGDLAFTPHNNLQFAPACDIHYDFRPSDRTALARSLLDAIHARHVVFALLDRTGYRVQAGIALAFCVSRYGNLDGEEPPEAWPSVKLTAREQLNRLRYASGEYGLIGRLPHKKPK